MARRRSIPRRRFVSAASAAALGALAGCPGTDEAGSDDGAENGSDGRNATDDNVSDGDDGSDDGNGTDPDDEGSVPDVEGTNLFVEVVDGEGVPVPGVTVTVSGGDYDGEEFETGPGGRVILQDVEPGEYVLAATVENGGDERTVSIEEGEDANVTLSVPASADRAGANASA